MCNVVPSVEELSKLSSKDPVICSICNKCFQGQSALKTHLKRSHKAVNNEEKKRYFCPLDNCSHNVNSSFPFSSLSALKQHFKLVHGTIRFKCSTCERRFKSKYSRNQHEVECGVRYLCSCNIEYTTKRGLLEHVKRQNHEIPKRLQELFNQASSKTKANLAPKKQIIRKTSRVILPKTLKKVRLFRLMSTSNLTPSKPDQVTVVMPNSVLHNLSKKQENSTLLTASRSIDKLLRVQNVSTHKHVSIQTEPPGQSSRDKESNRDMYLHHTIGTQTVEGMFEKTPIETYSTLSQTDFRHSVTSEFSNLPHAWNQAYMSCYSSQPTTVCDAQNQTVVENSYFAVTDDLSKLTRGDYETLASSSASVCASIETQTENEVNFLSTQTQTLGFSLPDQNDVETEMTFDVFLNDIETQTDLFLPALQESSSGFVNTYTQTPDSDFLSEILNLNS